jgi:hypothetical protein
MKVFILREGKEFGQGVAYLDDGTMVVVDGGRRLINKAVDIVVTSVHQTTAGKMIFGKVEDRSGQPAPAAAGAEKNVSEVPAARTQLAAADNRAPEGNASDHAPRPVFPESGRS